MAKHSLARAGGTGDADEDRATLRVLLQQLNGADRQEETLVEGEGLVDVRDLFRLGGWFWFCFFFWESEKASEWCAGLEKLKKKKTQGEWKEETAVRKAFRKLIPQFV